MTKRFEPLDIFRGLTVFLMIVVNTPGTWSSTFSPLQHASWHGFTPTDLVFPAFLFAVGNALAFVKVKWSNLSDREVLLKILKRSLIIFAIGYLLSWLPFYRWVGPGEMAFLPFDRTRIMGVLQRIAVCYLMAATLIYFFNKSALWLWSGFILFAYWAAMGTLGDYSLEGNFALTLDKIILGANHLYKGEGIPFDPEGLLSSFPAMVNIIGGYLLGAYLKDKGMNFESTAKIMIAGILLTLLAYFWHLGFPINKKIWTSSYVILTCGMCICIIALIIYFTQLSSIKFNLNFFQIFGKNPLFIFVLSIILTKIMIYVRLGGNQSLYSWLYQNTFGIFGGPVGSLGFALAFTMICWFFGWWMDQKRIYIRV